MSTSRVAVRGAFVFALLITAAAMGQTTQPVNITVDTSTRFQTIEGFGTALAQGTPTFSSQLLNMYTQDLGLSILRVPLDPNVIPGQITLGPDVQSNINLMNFNYYPQSGWGYFAQQVTANKLDQMKIIATIWSPPAWMKTSNSQNGGALIQTPQNLQQFARYVAAYVEGFQQAYGVPLYAVSIQNELRFSEPYPSTTYNPTQYVAALKAVGAEFAADGITTKIMGPEDVGVDGGSITADQMSFINAVKADPVANSYLGFYVIHGYAGNGSTASSSGANWAQYWNQIAGNGKESWQTEESGEDPSWVHFNSSGVPDGALAVALNMHEGLVYGNLNAWVYWQLDDGKTPVSQFTLESGQDPTSLKYNAFKHYSKFIRPGDVRVNATPDNAAGISVDAWVDDTNHLLIVNLINASAYDTQTTVAIPNTNFTSFSQVISTATQPWATLPDVQVQNGAVSLLVPANSIITLQSDGIAVPLPEPTGLTGVALFTLFLGRSRRSGV